MLVYTWNIKNAEQTIFKIVKHNYYEKLKYIIIEYNNYIEIFSIYLNFINNFNLYDIKRNGYDTSVKNRP